MAHRTPLTVRFNEIDPYRHVNHAVYLTYFEVGRTDALTCVGIPIEGLADDGIQLVITKVDVRFIKPALAGELLEVVTWLGESRRASQVWRQQIVRPAGADAADDGADDGADGADGEEILVEGDITIAVTDLSGRPRRPPAWLREAFTKLEPADVDAQTPDRSTAP